MDFKPDTDFDCILAYCSQNPEGLGDFIALIVKDKHVEFRFDLGSGVTAIRSNYVIQAGVWTHVVVSKDFKVGNLSVNGEPAVEGKSMGMARMMTLTTPIYIGGVDRRIVTVNHAVGTNRSFKGCVNDVSY